MVLGLINHRRSQEAPGRSCTVLECDPFPVSFLHINLDGEGSESEKLLYEEFAFLLCNYLTVFFPLLFSQTPLVLLVYTQELCGTLIFAKFCHSILNMF